MTTLLLFLLTVQSSAALDAASELSVYLNSLTYSFVGTKSTKISMHACQMKIVIVRSGNCASGEDIIDTTNIDLREVKDRVPYHQHDPEKSFFVLDFRQSVFQKIDDTNKKIENAVMASSIKTELSIQELQDRIIGEQISAGIYNSFREINTCGSAHKSYIGSGIVVFLKKDAPDLVASKISEYISTNCN